MKNTYKAVKRYKKKRNYRKKAYRKLGVFKRNLAPATYSIARKLIYSDTHTLNPGIGTIDYYQYSANGAYDPYIGGTGHQPRGFDEYMALYLNYCVVSSKMSVVFVNEDQSNTNVGFLTLSPTTTITFSNYNELEEFGKNKVFVLPSPGTDFNYTPYSRSIACSLRKWFKNNKLVQEPDYCGTDSANPAKQIYYMIGAQALNKVSDSGNIRIKVKIEYNIIFYNPRQIDGS